jgi:hypothetical protein
MKETVDDRIKRFVGYYRRAAVGAAEVGDSDHLPKLRKICYVAILDALGKAIYPSRGNRSRFTQLVDYFGEWRHSKRVSLPHLAALLDRCPDPAFEGLRALVRTELASWLSGTLIRLDRDPEIERVRSLWPKDPALRTPLETLSLDHFQHSHLLYTYRNLLVHEFRDRTDPIREDNRDVPFYVHASVIDYERDYERWDVFYPGGFLRDLTSRVLDNVEKYLLERQLDPSLHFSSGEYLLEALCQ